MSENTETQKTEVDKVKDQDKTVDPGEKPLTKRELEAELQKQRAEVEAERKKRELLEKQLADVVKKVDDVDKAKLDAPKKVEADPTPADGERYLKFMEEKQAARFKQLEDAAKAFQEKQEAEIERLRKEYREKELALFRNSLLSDVPERLRQYVVGKDEAELQSSKNAVKELEKELRDSIHKEVSKEVADKLPKPRNPSNVPSDTTNRTKTGRELRNQIVNDRKGFEKDFEARKNKLLQEKFGR